MRLSVQRRVLRRFPRWRTMPSSRRRVVGVTAAVIVIFVAGLLGAMATGRSGRVSGGARSSGGSRPAPSPAALTAAAVNRQHTASWIVAQAARSAIVGCDSVMCTALASAGFPPSNLLPLTPASPDPMGSTIVVATAAVRSQFGSKLPEVYAPDVLASFGTGSAAVQIRVIAPYGAAAFRQALSADLSARRASGAQLLHNTAVQVAGSPRSELAAGQVDSRLLATLVNLAAHYRVHIVTFGSQSPGASPGMPLRYAEVALQPSGGGPGGTQLLPGAAQLVNTGIPPYKPASVQPAQAGGVPVLQIEFAAPSPLKLLLDQSPPR
jgi:hypothetical protein